jgi:hypothetical protein
MQLSKRQSAQHGQPAAVPDCPDPSARVSHAKPTARRRLPQASDAPASTGPGSVAMPHGPERRYRTETRSSEPASHGLFSREPSESGLLRNRSVRVAGIVTNAASSVLCLLCRFRIRSAPSGAYLHRSAGDFPSSGLSSHRWSGTCLTSGVGSLELALKWIGRPAQRPVQRQPCNLPSRTG